ncbi:MAG: phosphate ABC transporter permease subunit PstC [Pseudomonadota bacterium]
MTLLHLLGFGLIISGSFFLISRFRLNALALQQDRVPRSLPRLHGLYAGCFAFAPVLVLATLWAVFAPSVLEALALNTAETQSVFVDALTRRQFLAELYSILEGQALRQPDPLVLQAAQTYAKAKAISFQAVSVLALACSIAAGIWALKRSTLGFNAHSRLDRLTTRALLFCSGIVVAATLAILVSLLLETLRFFELVNPASLLGAGWSPQSSLGDSQGGGVGDYGVAALLAGTAIISLVAIALAAPLGLMVAMYLSQYANRSARRVAKPLLEVLAGIPTVVYGFFAVLVVAPALRGAGQGLGLDISAQSALAAGLVMGVMITPYVSSLCEDAISAVPAKIRDGSLALGATRAETIWRVLLPSALPGISSAFLLAISRTIGETMIVLMAAGLAANLTANPLESVTTVTVQIVQALTGELQFDSAKTLSAFMLGMILFILTLFMNITALALRRRHQRKVQR